MSKELSPLEALKEVRETRVNVSPYGFYDYDKYGDELCDIIETALKDYEKKNKLAKEYADVNNVAKRLKALEIIKEKKVDVFQLLIAIKLNDLNEYNKRHAKYLHLTKEEYDLLQEVLKCQRPLKKEFTS